ncbi:PSD1 and planctomycete cytochrome C domain-containing protein [Alienimonas sp. DA493]|uniref:PSD1 and planctomycete cytochrome C domain-containing protein n=1 Tax=Alienimonas sp. DA493 TaxID=3373605 RepID=UPI003754FB4F
MLATLFASGIGPQIAVGDDRPTGEQLEFFEREIRPLLAEHCYECHSAAAERLEANLLLDSRAGHLAGGDYGPSIVPGDADGSLLIEAVRYESYEMPPKGQLAEEEIAALVRWVEMGAPWPDEAAPVAERAGDAFDLERRKEEHWSWQPVAAPAIPEVADPAWPHGEIDRFVLAELDEAGLAPAPDADRTALLRRLHFDLIGLPPTPEDVEAFLADDRPGALERVVDRLLASPHFGERWARHWLDLVRYAESRGHEFDNDAPNAFQYRDYVIRAFNADVPYDQFVREHIAGDLLEEPRRHPTEGFNESVLGTGFWFLGEWVHSPVDTRKDEADRFDNMIDVASKTFLGVTVACARCHDHKFDAISTADYYSLSGFLQSSDYRQVRFESMEQNRRVSERLASVDAKYRRRLVELLERRGVRRPSETGGLKDEAVVVDYADLPQSLYLQDGFLFGPSPRPAGAPHLSAAADEVTVARFGAAVSDPIWSGLESVTEGTVHNRSELAKLPKSGRTLRSPTFELKDGVVSCRIDGAGHVVACVDSHRLVAGPLHKETIVAVKPDRRWTTLNLSRYVGHRLHLEFVPAADTRMTVRMVVQGLDADGRADLDRRLAALDQPAEEYARAAEAVLNADEAAAEIVRAWRAERDRLASQIVRTSRLAPAMMDGSGEDGRILIRGNPSKPGDVEPRHFLTAISGDDPLPIPSGSGRLALADEITAPDNPLTARVVVNRVWHHLMGRGIVPTVDDLGVLGQRPTHPELLDHLAARFLEDGQSLKGLIKSVALSRTYRMSSYADPAALAVDPNNELWHHRPPRRLQGEAIRDALLVLSGRFDPTAFGPPVPIHLTPFMDGRGRPAVNGPPDGDGRRSVYVAVRRNFLSPFMLTFDTPAPFSSMGRRNVSNVPAQALILLNDPLVADLSRQWSERALAATPGADDDATARRLERMYLSAFGRRPTDRERGAASRFLAARASERGVAPDDASLWADFAHVLVNTKEFIFLR